MNRFVAREQIEDILHPLNGYRGKLEAQGKEPKDHMKQNKMALRKTADQFMKKQTDVVPVKPADTFKMKKFSNIPSKVKEDLEMQNEQSELKPVVQRPGSARNASGAQKVIFGRSYSS